MKKFTLKLSNRMWVEHFEELMSLERKFQSMSVFLPSFHYEKSVELLIKVSLRYGSQIRSLTLNESEFDHLQDFCDILESLPLLEVLEVNKTVMKEHSKEDLSSIQPVILKQLKTLIFRSSSWSLFQCLVGSQVTNAIVFNMMLRITDRDCFVKFLEESRKLESLEIDSRVFVRTFELEFRKSFEFKLKRFKFLWHFPQTDIGDADKNLSLFLATQTSSLEELELNYLTHELLRVIFVKLRNVRKLRFNSTCLPTDKNFYDQLKPVNTLKEIIAHDQIPNEEAARGLLGICPNLNSLQVLHDPENLINKILPFTAVYNTKLNALSLESFKNEVDAGIKLNSLKFLHVETFANFEFLLSFLRSHPAIDTLSIKVEEHEEALIYEFLHVLMEEPKLKNLKFAGSFKTLKSIYDSIKVDYKHLKSLELKLNTDKKDVKPPLVFNFPSDVTQWISRCDFFDD